MCQEESRVKYDVRISGSTSQFTQMKLGLEFAWKRGYWHIMCQVDCVGLWMSLEYEMAVGIYFFPSFVIE